MNFQNNGGGKDNKSTKQKKMKPKPISFQLVSKQKRNDNDIRNVPLEPLLISSEPKPKLSLNVIEINQHNVVHALTGRYTAEIIDSNVYHLILVSQFYFFKYVFKLNKTCTRFCWSYLWSYLLLKLLMLTKKILSCVNSFT